MDVWETIEKMSQSHNDIIDGHLKLDGPKRLKMPISEDQRRRSFDIEAEVQYNSHRQPNFYKSLSF